MSKTPYEIRLELLRIANEVLTTPVFQAREAFLSEFHNKFEVDKTASFPSLPNFPSTEDILVEAEKLNKFVSQS